MEQALIDQLASQAPAVAILAIVLYLGYKLYLSQVDRAALVSDREAAESQEVTQAYIAHLERENEKLLNHFLSSTLLNGGSVPSAGKPGSALAQAQADLLDDVYPPGDAL